MHDYIHKTRQAGNLLPCNYVTGTPPGALAGAGVLFGMTPARLHSNLGVTMVMGRTGRGQAFGIEFVSTFVLVFAYFASCEPASWRFKPLPVGLAIAAGTVFGVSDLCFGHCCRHRLWRE